VPCRGFRNRQGASQPERSECQRDRYACRSRAHPLPFARTGLSAHGQYDQHTQHQCLARASQMPAIAVQKGETGAIGPGTVSVSA
jgi:hypothetical protein